MATSQEHSQAQFLGYTRGNVGISAFYWVPEGEYGGSYIRVDVIITTSGTPEVAIFPCNIDGEYLDHMDEVYIEEGATVPLPFEEILRRAGFKVV